MSNKRNVQWVAHIGYNPYHTFRVPAHVKSEIAALGSQFLASVSQILSTAISTHIPSPGGGHVLPGILDLCSDSLQGVTLPSWPLCS